MTSDDLPDGRPRGASRPLRWLAWLPLLPMLTACATLTPQGDRPPTAAPAAAAADAKIICDGLTYDLTYTDGGAAVKKEDTLNANETKNLTLKLAFESNSLPADDVSISDLGITITYAQN